MTAVIFTISLIGTAQKMTLYTIGDSTMANKENPETNPEHGWAQQLPLFFSADVRIENKAVNGRSSKSFIAEGRWDSIVHNLKPGDYVFIQFGHNDQKQKDSSRYTNPYTAYRYNLIKFIQESRQKGAHPILLSPIVRRNFNSDGVLVDTHGNYPLSMRMVAQEYKVPFIDLQYLSESLEQAYGPVESKKLHLHFAPGEHPYYPDGIADNTHLSELGATLLAAAVAEALVDQKSPLSPYISLR